jgi:alkylation response protein AidB-like acyl-CoA dehydrogenase
MLTYKAPARDIQFVTDELLNARSHYAALQGCEQVADDLRAAILDGAAQFAEEVIAPLNHSGDQEGCHFDQGAVTTPKGFREAFHQYGDGGWQALSIPVAEGGQGLPASVGVPVAEMMGSANWAWSMYCGLSQAPVTCLLHGGTEEQKKFWLPKLLTLQWAGTMCLTEAHCGSDVGLLKTKAVKQADGTYKITGTKIFISSGEHDLTENIIHAVLARIEGAPGGTSGISLFIVPKILVNQDGSLGKANQVSCGAIEKKMGIKASATCVMNFDGAIGYLVGEENKGLKIMFAIMNQARLGTAMQGLSHAEAGYQGSLKYAKERLAMRALSGPTNPQGPADPIIDHPDVRRMLLTQKSLIEGSRAFLYWLSYLTDIIEYGNNEEEKKQANDTLSLLTPVAKAFCTESAFESVNLGLQIFGGHGYISENGMEQLVRDARIAMVYEGTTGIQALDLLGRKVMGSGGEQLRKFTKQIHLFCEANKNDETMKEFVEPLAALNKEWGESSLKIGDKVMKSLDEVGAASVDFTMYSGYIVLAYMWAQMVKVSLPKQTNDFYRTKIQTARFYYQRVLPRTKAHLAMMLAGKDSMMAIDKKDF